MFAVGHQGIRCSGTPAQHMFLHPSLHQDSTFEYYPVKISHFERSTCLIHNIRKRTFMKEIVNFYFLLEINRLKSIYRVDETKKLFA